MGLNFRPQVETRSLNWPDGWGAVGSSYTLGSGAEAALALVPVYAAIREISEAFASTPLYAYGRSKDGTTFRLPEQPALIANPSGLGHSVYSWKMQCIVSLLLRGNAYGIARNKVGGWPTSIDWLNPDLVTVNEYPDGRRPDYYWNGQELAFEDVVHIPWIVQPGKWKGLSPLEAFQQSWEMGAAAQKMSRDFYANSSVPGGHLKNTAKVLDKTEALVTKAQFKAAVSGRDIFVSGNDWEFNTLTLPPEEAQFLQAMQMSANQVATIYGIPPERIGGVSQAGSLHYDTEELTQIAFMTNTMRPWFTRVEGALSQGLRNNIFAKFDMDSQIRVDFKTKMEGAEIGQRAGMLTNAEARALDDRAPLTDEEMAVWQQSWGKSSKELSAAEQIQKIYLGVGKVITIDEARKILRDSGVELDDNVDPQKIFDSLAPSPGAAQEGTNTP